MTNTWSNTFGVLIILLLFSFPLVAHQYEFEKVDVTLSQNSVHHLLQDHQGYIWLATQNGVNRYDGYTIKVYTADKEAQCRLPHAKVQTLLQDSSGQIWAGTANGVAILEPASDCFRPYLEQPASVSVAANDIGVLFEDSRQRVWMLGNNLTLFSLQDKLFKQIATAQVASGVNYNEHVVARESSPTYNAIYQSPEQMGLSGKIWLGGLHGLSLFNEQTQQIDLVFKPPQHSRWQRDNPVTSIVQLDQQTLWLATQEGVYHVSVDGRQLAHYRFNPQHSDAAIAQNYINQLYIDKHNQLWAATSNGLSRYLAAENRFVHYLKAPDNTLAPTNRVDSLLTDSQGQLWVGAQDGVYLYDKQKDHFWHYGAKKAHGLGITNGGNAYRLSITRSGTLYVSVQLDGLYKMRPFKHKFNHITHLDELSNVYDNNVTRAIFEEPDSQGQVVWLGLDGAGVKRIAFRQDERGHKIIDKVQRYRHQNSSKGSTMSGEYIHAIHRDAKNRLWLATNNGVRRWNDHQQDFIADQLNEQLPQLGQVSAIYKTMIYAFLDDKQTDKLWFGGDHLLGYQYTAQNNTLYKWFTSDDYPELKNNLIYKMFQDEAGIIWLATSNGLGRFDPVTEQLSLFSHQSDNPNSLSVNWVHGIWEMPRATYWLATRGGGLNRLTFDDKNKPQWQHFTEKDGLANNTLYGLLGDNDGNLWFSSNKGLTRFDTDDHSVRNYSPDDGLQGYEYNYGVAHLGRSGQFYFGGINGFNIFRPAQIRDNTIVAKTALTRLTVNNKEIELSRLKQEKAAPGIAALALPYYDNNLTFEYVGLHFDAPERNQYAYKLAGIDKDWVYDGVHRSARYSALPPGDYQFFVKVANDDGMWSEPHRLISVTIVPPIWQTVSAYLSYILMLILLGWLYKKQRDNKEHKLQQRIAHATSELASANEHIRLQFQSFAHEVKTPLMSVSNHCALAMLRLDKLNSDNGTFGDNYDDKIVQQVKVSLSQASTSLDDIRRGVKQELDNAELRIKNSNKQLHLGVTSCLDSLLRTRLHSAEQNQLTLTVSLDDKAIICTQPGVIELVIGNLLDNAIQYTAAGGQVALNVSVTNQHVQFEVSDSGRGIAADEQDKIFLHSYRGLGLENTQGRGMGLYLVKATLENNNGEIRLQSEIDKGSRFIVTLPKGNADKILNQSISRIVLPNIDKPVCFSEKYATATDSLPVKAHATNEADRARLLIVEDNDDLRHSLQQIFGEFYHCIGAENGEQGLVAAIKYNPDLVVTDVRMESLYSGIELVEALKSHIDTCHIPVIVCSAMSDSQTKLNAVKAQADVWVDKSASIEVLIAHVHTLLNQKYRIQARIKQELQTAKQNSNSSEQITSNPHAHYFCTAVKAVITEAYLDGNLNLDTLLSQNLKESTRNIQYKAKKYLPQDLTLKLCLNGYRGLQAIKLLSETDLPIKAIYLEAGFANERQMSRWFDKYLSLKPSQYRKGFRPATQDALLSQLDCFFNPMIEQELALALVD